MAGLDGRDVTTGARTSRGSIPTSVYPWRTNVENTMNVWNASGTEKDSRFIAISLVHGKFVLTYPVSSQNPAVFPPNTRV